MNFGEDTRSNSTLASKTDWQSKSKSAERKRCTKKIANGSQMHRTAIEPMSIAWKATMLSLHQLYSHEFGEDTRSNSTLASKTDWQSNSKSAERKRYTKTIANGWQLHRTGMEPMSIASKANMLPLHQRCSHQELWLYNEKQSSCVKNWLRIGEKKCRENAAPKQSLTDHKCIVRESNRCQ